MKNISQQVEDALMATGLPTKETKNSNDLFISGLAKLRAPFPDHQIGKLPKETRYQIDERKKDSKSAINCQVCGGWHHRNAIHLEYVGHAALTDRLLEVDPTWSYEPLALTSDGLPLFDSIGGLWIKLTILGVTRLGYGSADGALTGNIIKEVLGDALRNAAMRFGCALEYWHKGILHFEKEEQKPENEQLFTTWILPIDDFRTVEETAEWWRKGVGEIKASHDMELYKKFREKIKRHAEKLTLEAAKEVSK